MAATTSRSYSNKAVDTGLTDARAITDPAARIAAYQAVDKTIGADLPVIPVMFYKHHHVASDRLHEMTYSAMGLADFVTVWIDDAAAAK